jgi:hypothetical protein
MANAGSWLQVRASLVLLPIALVAACASPDPTPPLPVVSYIGTTDVGVVLPDAATDTVEPEPDVQDATDATVTDADDVTATPDADVADAAEDVSDTDDAQPDADVAPDVPPPACLQLGCTDGNPCTDDHCDAKIGCVFTHNAFPCSDGNACTQGDTCQNAACKSNAPVVCNDGNACTNDACNPATGCVFSPNAVTCDDGNVCTSGDACKNASCQSGVLQACADGNPCTHDVCDAKTGCVFPPRSGACDDADSCTLSDVCNNGACQPGQPMPCNDGNFCTTDACVNGKGCVFSFTTSPCDDGNACTSQSVCAQGECVGTAATTCSDGNGCTLDGCDPSKGCVFAANTLPCSDGDLCTQSDQCGNGACQPGTKIACTDSNACTNDSCNPLTGCVFTPNTAPCDDGSACSLGDRCGQGSCQPGPAVTCTDGNPCTDDTCNPAVGCVFTANTAPCQDGDVCTVDDACAAAACRPGTARTCQDGNACTNDSCNPLTGCVYAPNTLACDDQDACTQGDACQSGSCQRGTAIPCNDQNPCTDDTCNPLSGCVFSANTAPCDDGSACTLKDACQASACKPGAPRTCDDGNLCTDDSCNAATGCVATPNVAPCNDNSACTQGDLCSGGSCAPGAFVVCQDGNPCTDDACNPSSGCVFSANTVPCDDGSACTLGDACQAAACQPGAPLACNDGNPCTDDGCEAATGCVITSNAAPCDDGNACTSNDGCVQGACVPGAPLECDDKNPCTDDSCQGQQGCLHAANAGTCEDGDACTQGEFCSGGACQPGKPVTCSDGNNCTFDLCNSLTGCVFPANDNAACDPGDLCVNGGTCQAGQCQPGAVISCDDGNPCSDDVCVVTTGCSHTANTGPCEDSNACTAGDTCQAFICIPGGQNISCTDGNPCTTDQCDPAQGCSYPPISGLCDDGNACTQADTCQAGSCVGGLATNCDDGNACTDDACGPATGCFFTNNVATCDDGNACSTGDKCVTGSCTSGAVLSCQDGNPCTDTSCSPATGCQYLPMAGPCVDGDACTTGETCVGIVCTPGAALTCLDGNPCTTDACDPVTGCDFQVSTGACEDGDACTTGDVCKSAACVPGPAVVCTDSNPCTDDSCSFWLGCQFTPNKAPCDDGTACTVGDGCLNGVCTSGAPPNCDDGNACTDDKCDAAGGCVSTANALPCTDGDACTNGDVCKVGACATGAPLPCSDGNSCTTDSCNPLSGCVFPPNTAPCDDGTACTLGDKCAGGLCVAGTPAVCVDGNVCTDDVCDAKLGCTYPANIAVCDDGDNCTGPDVCAAGACKPPVITCDDKDPCTTDACQPADGSCKNTFVAGPGCAPSIQGTVTYTWVNANDSITEGGARIEYGTAADRPARRLLVEAIDAADGVTVRAATSTDDLGSYTLTTPPGVPVKVRVSARVYSAAYTADGIGDDNCNGASFDFQVRDNTSGYALYTMEGPLPVAAPLKANDLHAGMEWNVAYLDRTAAPFAIADTAVTVLETVCQGQANIALPTLWVNWAVNNVEVSGDKTKGQITTAHYTRESIGMTLRPVIYLRGKEDSNTDEYDDHIVAHEMTHFLTDMFYRDDSMGGPHGYGDNLDIRVSFSEGTANAFGSLALRDPVPVDTSGWGQAGGWSFDVSEATLPTERSMHSEWGVQHFMWTLWENRDTTLRSGSYDRIHAVLASTANSPALMTVLTFAAAYNAAYGATGDDLSNVWSTWMRAPYNALCAGACKGSGDVADPWDSDGDIGVAYATAFEYTTGTGKKYAPGFWTVYPLLSSGTRIGDAHEQIHFGIPFDYFNWYGPNRFYRLVGTGVSTTVAVASPVGGTCAQNNLDMQVLSVGTSIASDGSATGCPSITFTPKAGESYVVWIYAPTGAPVELTGWNVVRTP